MLDYDLDGWEDLYLQSAGGDPFQSNSPPSSLFRNHNGTFVNVGVVSQSTHTGYGQGVCAGDVNEDGFTDLLLTNMVNHIF